MSELAISREQIVRPEHEDLKKDLIDLQNEVSKYKFASESFEKRVLDLQLEIAKRDKQLKEMKEKLKKSLAENLVLRQNNEPRRRKLFVGGLPSAACDTDLYNYFSQFGRVIDAMVVKDSKSRKLSRGFGFVIFLDPLIADAVLSSGQHKILDKEVEIKAAIPKHPTFEPKQEFLYQAKRIFIGGLKSTTTDEILVKYFESFGEVESVNVMGDNKSGKSRGFAYVTFKESDVADKVIAQKTHVIDGRKCEAKPAFSKIFRNFVEPVEEKVEVLDEQCSLISPISSACSQCHSNEPQEGCGASEKNSKPSFQSPQLLATNDGVGMKE